jgi:hypothetical protein
MIEALLPWSVKTVLKEQQREKHRASQATTS